VETCYCCQGQQQQQQQQRRGQENQATAVEQRAEDEVDAMETCRRAMDSGMEIQVGLRDGIVHVVPDYWHWLLPVTLQIHHYTPLQLYHIIIIIIERKDLGGVMSKDCKDKH